MSILNDSIMESCEDFDPATYWVSGAIVRELTIEEAGSVPEKAEPVFDQRLFFPDFTV